MNVLLFVTTMLLVLSLMTYVRIESYRYSSGLQSQFERYMRTIERSYINQVAIKWYDTTIANKKKGGIKDLKSPASKASSRLSLAFLVDPEQNNTAASSQTLQWAKNLIEVLYSTTDFYQAAKQKDPAFVDHLLDAMARAIREEDPDQRPKTTGDLANLVLVDPMLKDVFYYIFKGCPNLEETAHPTAQEALSQPGEDNSETDENDDADEALEYHDDKSYTSLMNYITINKSSGVRVYLASRPLLTAIFGSAQVADSIITARSQIYHSVIGGMDPAEASTFFQSSFQSYFHGSDSSLLDFKVTKTNPSHYN